MEKSVEGDDSTSQFSNEDSVDLQGRRCADVSVSMNERIIKFFSGVASSLIKGRYVHEHVYISGSHDQRCEGGGMVVQGGRHSAILSAEWKDAGWGPSRQAAPQGRQGGLAAAVRPL